MICRSMNVFGAAVLALLATATVANAQLTLVPNGDFSTAGGDSWNVAASAGTVISFPATGGADGASDGYGQIDNTAGAWGGVLVAEGGTGPGAGGGIPLGDLDVVAGGTYDIQLDMIQFGAAGGMAGIKMESWSETAVISDSGDQNFTLTSAWDTYTFSGYTIEPTATRLKFVPLLAGAGQLNVGFDNVGIVPEPASLALFSLGGMGLAILRRRK